MKKRETLRYYFLILVMIILGLILILSITSLLLKLTGQATSIDNSDTSSTEEWLNVWRNLK